MIYGEVIGILPNFTSLLEPTINVGLRCTTELRFAPDRSSIMTMGWRQPGDGLPWAESQQPNFQTAVIQIIDLVFERSS
jgi:hypothetical protein